MCGIVGYWGNQSPKDIIVAGLKKLEYRGYDSAGVAILDHGKFKRVRAEGKLKNLEEKLLTENFSGHIGIGHTRWATHGVPSVRNAHPHQVGGISLVHNGIIENYLEIREELVSRNAQISSDTDSELVAHLLNEEVQKTKDLFKAVVQILQKLRGAFSIVVAWDQSPNELVAFKDGPPMVVGIGQDEVFIVSDVQAAIQYTKRFVYLNDREIVRTDKGQASFFDHNGKQLNKEIVELKWTSEQVEKMGYSHFMLKEIYEQPLVVASALAPHLYQEVQSGSQVSVAGNQVAEKSRLRLSQVGFGTSPQELDKLDIEADWKKTKEIFKSIDRVFFIACGTSYYAAQTGKYLIEKLAGIPVETDIASEFRYRSPVLTPNTLLITISQSGETADTLAALRLAKDLGAKTLSICNVRNSSIDREASGHLYMNAGTEVGVASTKAFMATLTVLNVLATVLAEIKGKLTEVEIQKQISALQALPSQMEVVLAYDKYFAEASERLKEFKGFLYLGRGVHYPIAMEGALKLKELAYLHAEGYAAGEMKHGPLALIDERMAIIVVAPDDDLFEKTVSNLEEAKARGGKIISIGTNDSKKLKSLSQQYIGLPKSHWTTNPLLAVIPLQLMAFHLANTLGHDVDQPRNLAKSVTVE